MRAPRASSRARKIGDLSERLDADPGRVSRLLREMRAAGLVEVWTTDGVDGRSRPHRLTHRGAPIAQRLAPADEVEAPAAEVTAVVSAEPAAPSVSPPPPGSSPELLAELRQVIVQFHGWT